MSISRLNTAGAFLRLKGVVMMPKNEEKRECKNMTITIRGHEVILNFAEKANPQVATQVKQALLGTYLLTAK